MTTTITAEEREKALMAMAERQLAAEKAQEKVEAFLNDSTVPDTQREVRKKVYEDYLKQKLEKDPTIILRDGVFEDLYAVGLEILEDKMKAASTGTSAGSEDNKQTGQEAAATNAAGGNTGAQGAPATPQAAPPNAGEQGSKTVVEAIKEFKLPESKEKELLNSLRMSGIDV